MASERAKALNPAVAPTGRDFSMAVGRTLQQRILKPGPLHPTGAAKRIPWRLVVLICMAITAASFATYGLIVDPPDTSREAPSFLP
jgi:hypothetical protein